MSSDQYSTPPSGQSQPPAKESLAAGEPKIEYFQTLNYFFEHPDWTNSLLMGSVCMLIPILNGILLAGYRYEIVEMKVRFPDQLYPKFDFARFSQYITRGVWPFLIDFLVQMVLTVPILVVVYGSMIGIFVAVANDERAGIIVIAIVVPLLILFMIAVSLVLSVVMVPLYLRAGLSQDFGQVFKFAWIKDFLAKVWLPTLLFNMFLMVTGGILGILGELACFIGLFPVIFLLGGPIVGHAHYQLYRLYLARGGEPIPLKPLPVEPTLSGPAPGFTPPPPM
jgi:Protein of unknown function (DUF4013)